MDTGSRDGGLSPSPLVLCNPAELFVTHCQPVYSGSILGFPGSFDVLEKRVEDAVFETSKNQPQHPTPLPQPRQLREINSLWSFLVD